MGRLICALCANSGHGVPIRSPRQPAPGLALLEKGVEKRLGSLAMTGRRTNHEWQGDSVCAGVLLASMFWIVLAQQSYCAGSVADWLHMGDVEECR
jgi:hypothetical protein